ncbi:protein of unknown function (plasmid) [Cupriavidus taiwanensis]|uniref:Uncharacterized protein n=1 Tax=Cupriavidus taiwanensis TaxID=164546 RepID=A0A9Q7V1B3_9BURK|nr:protein of unknown function [Cupriavidus taiwanensis]
MGVFSAVSALRRSAWQAPEFVSPGVAPIGTWESGQCEAKPQSPANFARSESMPATL